MFPAASVKLRVTPSTVTVTSGERRAVTLAGAAPLSGVPETVPLVRVPLRETVRVLASQLTFLPMSSPMARTGR